MATIVTDFSNNEFATRLVDTSFIDIRAGKKEYNFANDTQLQGKVITGIASYSGREMDNYGQTKKIVDPNLFKNFTITLRAEGNREVINKLPLWMINPNLTNKHFFNIDFLAWDYAKSYLEYHGDLADLDPSVANSEVVPIVFQYWENEAYHKYITKVAKL